MTNYVCKVPPLYNLWSSAEVQDWRETEAPAVSFSRSSMACHGIQTKFDKHHKHVSLLFPENIWEGVCLLPSTQASQTVLSALCWSSRCKQSSKLRWPLKSLAAHKPKSFIIQLLLPTEFSACKGYVSQWQRCSSPVFEPHQWVGQTSPICWTSTFGDSDWMTTHSIWKWKSINNHQNFYWTLGTQSETLGSSRDMDRASTHLSGWIPTCFA